MRRVWRVAIVLLALAAGASAQPPRSARGTGGVPPTALTRAQLAQQLFREGSVEDALELYREIDAAHPGVTRIVQGIRSCLLELKRYDELREHLEADLTLHPNNPSVLEELGTVAARTGDRDAATGHWRAILAIQPGSHGAYSHVADLFMRHRMLDEAMAVYREAEKAHPGRFVRRIGNLHEVRMEFAAATHAYLDFLLMNPSTLSFVEGRLLRIGESEEGLGRVIARVDSAFAASSGAEHSPGARIALRKLLADLHLEAGDHARARDRYFDLVDALPGQLPTLLVFGRRCMADERFEVAVTVFERVLAESADARAVPGALSEIAVCRWHLGQWEEALRILAELVDRFPETEYAIRARFETGRVLRDGKRDPQSAEAVFRELLPLRDGPWEPGELHFEIAECALHLSETDRALDIYRAVAERVFPEATLERALYNEARVLYYRAEFDAADSLFKRVAERYPKGRSVNNALEHSILINTNREDEEALARHAAASLGFRIGDVEAALLTLGEAVVSHRGSPVHDDLLLLWGMALREQDRVVEALDALRRAADMTSVEDLAARALLLRARIFGEDLGDATEALAQYEEVVLSYPETLAADRARASSAELRRALP